MHFIYTCDKPPVFGDIKPHCSAVHIHIAFKTPNPSDVYVNICPFIHSNDQQQTDQRRAGHVINLQRYLSRYATASKQQLEQPAINDRNMQCTFSLNNKRSLKPMTTPCGIYRFGVSIIVVMYYFYKSCVYLCVIVLFCEILYILLFTIQDS